MIAKKCMMFKKSMMALAISNSILSTMTFGMEAKNDFVSPSTHHSYHMIQNINTRMRKKMLTDQDKENAIKMAMDLGETNLRIRLENYGVELHDGNMPKDIM